MTKLLAILALFRKGNAVANPELWKNGGAALQVALTGFIISMAATGRVFGFDIPINIETAGAIAAGVMAVASVCVTYISSKRVGLPAAAAPPAPEPNGMREGP
jgi:NhaP-type Na+/H+ or K+/H+ antiporter